MAPTRRRGSYATSATHEPSACADSTAFRSSHTTSAPTPTWITLGLLAASDSSIERHPLQPCEVEDQADTSIAQHCRTAHCCRFSKVALGPCDERVAALEWFDDGARQSQHFVDDEPEATALALQHNDQLLAARGRVRQVEDVREPH